MILRENKLLIMSVLLMGCLLVSTPALAEELTFQEAVNLGFQNNTEILRAKNNVHQLERELKKIKADAGWQLTTNVESQINNFNSNLTAGEDTSEEMGITLSGSRSYWWGMTLSPQLYSEKRDLSQGNLESSEVNFKLNADQDIYPLIPTTSEQNYIQKQVELIKARKNLAEEKNNKLINWLEEYLTVVKAKERYSLAQKRYDLAQNKLEEVLARREIKEAGETEVLSVRADLKRAEYNLKQAENNYRQAEKSLSNKLGIAKEQKLAVTASSKSIVKLEQIADSAAVDLTDKERLINLGKENSHQLLQNELDRENLSRQLKWQKAKEKPDVDLKGSYDTGAEEWSVGVNLTYNIFDGGGKELEIKNLTEQMKIYRQEYQDLINQIKLEVDNLTNQVTANQINLEEKELSFKKAELEAEIAGRQLDKGLIDQSSFREKKLALQEAKISFQEAEDKLLISKLELISFLGIFNLEGELK